MCSMNWNAHSVAEMVVVAVVVVVLAESGIVGAVAAAVAVLAVVVVAVVDFAAAVVAACSKRLNRWIVQRMFRIRIDDHCILLRQYYLQRTSGTGGTHSINVVKH